jgi:hypothetical protein
MEHLQGLFRPDSLGRVNQDNTADDAKVGTQPPTKPKTDYRVEQAPNAMSRSYDTTSTPAPAQPPTRGSVSKGEPASDSKGASKGGSSDSLTTSHQPPPAPSPTSTPENPKETKTEPAPQPAPPTPRPPAPAPMPYSPSPVYSTPSTPSDAQTMVPQTATPPRVIIIPKYNGCTSRFHKTRRTFSVYCPVGWVAPQNTSVQLGHGFGADVTPPPPPNMIKVADEVAEPPEAPANGATEDDVKPFYKNWKFWAIALTAVAAIGAGGFVIYRRRKAHAP